MNWLSLVLTILPHVARGILEGSHAAGVDHDTIAQTIAKVTLVLLQSPPSAPLPSAVTTTVVVPAPAGGP